MRCRRKWMESVFNEEANHLCGVCFFIESSCNPRHDWSYRVKFIKLFRGCQSGIHADDHHRFMAVVFWTCTAGRYFGKLDSSGKLMALLNKVSALVVWGVAVYMAIRLSMVISWIDTMVIKIAATRAYQTRSAAFCHAFKAHSVPHSISSPDF